MRLTSKEIEHWERIAKVINGLVIVVKEDGIIRQITSMEKLKENRFQMVDKAKRKR